MTIADLRQEILKLMKKMPPEKGKELLLEIISEYSKTPTSRALMPTTKRVGGEMYNLPIDYPASLRLIIDKYPIEFKHPTKRQKAYKPLVMYIDENEIITAKVADDNGRIHRIQEADFRIKQAKR